MSESDTHKYMCVSFCAAQLSSAQLSSAQFYSALVYSDQLCYALLRGSGRPCVWLCVCVIVRVCVTVCVCAHTYTFFCRWWVWCLLLLTVCVWLRDCMYVPPLCVCASVQRQSWVRPATAGHPCWSIDLLVGRCKLTLARKQPVSKIDSEKG